MRAVKKALFMVGLPAVLVALWWLSSANSTNPYFPPLQDILGTFPDTWSPEQIRSNVLPSLARLTVGVAVAIVLGVSLGVAVGSSSVLRAATEPVLEFLRAIPPPVLIPVLILFAGIGDSMKVMVIVWGCLWPVLLNTVDGVKEADGVLSDTCRIYGISGRSRLTRFILPSAGPRIFAGMRQALSLGIILMVIGEMFASTNGLGFAVIQFQREFSIPQMWTGIILLGLIGVLLSVLFGLAERRVLAWYFGLRRQHMGDVR